VTKDGRSPLVTVVSLCFNTGRFVIEALECLRRQTFRSFEVVVVDDGSTDDSVARLEGWARSAPFAMSLIRNEANLGIPASLNRAIGDANGDLITWLNDDLWDDDRLEIVVACFEDLPEDVQVLFGDAIVIDAAGDEIGYLSPANTLDVVGFPHDPALLPAPGEFAVIPGPIAREALYWRCFIPAPSVTVRRTLYDAVGPYDEGLAVEDVDCWFRASSTGDFAYLRRPLVKYRQHHANFSSGRSEAYLATLAEVLARYSSPNGARHRSAIKRHLREESYRVASGLFAQRERGPALHALRSHYLPNLQLTMSCFKESCRLVGRAVGVPRAGAT
jgi:glycosyltransferase involved in cell wall biosynthesis